jgi:hypothetical protein
VSRPGKPVDTGDEFEAPPGWHEVQRGRWLHDDGASCLFAVDQRSEALAFAWVAVNAAGQNVGAFTRADGWLAAAMAEATR